MVNRHKREHKRPWRLPDGVKFYIYPQYILVVEGVTVKLSPTQAKIILFLMANPGRRFHSDEIMEAIFEDREDGGATNKNYVPVCMVNIQDRCNAVGVEICLKQPGAYLGYAFMRVGLTDKGRSEAVRRAALPTSDPKSPSHPAKFKTVKVVKPPKGKKGPVLRHPHIDTFDSTGGWTFPHRVERYLQGQRLKADAK